MNIEKVQGLIEKSILSGRQIVIDYTKSNGDSDRYLILAITSTWQAYFNTVAESVSKGKTRPFTKFRYDRISSVDITDQIYDPSDHLVEKIRDGSLFSDTDNRIDRRGGLKGYPSSINYISEPHQRLSKPDAQKLIREISIPPLDGWLRGVVLKVDDGDTYDILLEADLKGSYVTRLFGVDAPECKEGSIDFVLGLEAKVFVEDMFKESCFCYVKKRGKDAFRRHLMHVLNSDKKNIAIELLENGLGVPMMGYFEESDNRREYEAATKKAYESKKGLWSIEEIGERYNNIISDTVTTEIDLFGAIHEKKSAIARYLKQNPSAKIIRAAFYRKTRSEFNKKTAKDIFKIITRAVNLNKYDVDSYKTMCDLYLDEISRIEELSDNIEVVKDCIMHIEDMVDELKFGDGKIKGNFSKGKNKLIYHDDPESRWYKLCIPEILFRTVKDAKYCGFKKA